MDPNFNIVGNMNKTKISNENKNEEEQEKNDQNQKKSPNKNKSAKQKMTRFMLIIIGGIGIIFALLAIFSLFTKKEYSYTDLEKILKEAAISYFHDHKDRLPQTNHQIVEIESTTLVAAEKMKDLQEYTKEELNCSGKVLVEKTENNYLYTPYLDCGTQYITKELYKKVIEDNQPVTSGYGLYQNNGTYIYRGENLKNYIQLDKATWRIVKITSENNLVLIKEEEIGNSRAWDDRYNTEINYTAGVNNYNTSRIKEYLEKSYQGKQENEEVYLSKEDKTKLSSFDLCIGKREEQEIGNDNSIECSGEKLNNQKIGLLTLSEYMNASIDSNCKTAESKSCQNYNYLATDYDWWLLTASKNKSYEVYTIEQDGNITLSTASTYANVRPVIYLNNKVLYKSGKGTKENPYKIK